MPIKQIFISNVLEGFYKSYDFMPEEQRQARYLNDFYEANRALFYGSDHKLVITSYLIEPVYLSDIKNLLAWQSVLNIYPDKPSPSICQDLIDNQALSKQLLETIQANPGVELIPYRTTKQFFNLVKHLHSLNLDFSTPETASPENEFIVNYYNNKRGFRHLWATVSGAMPKEIQVPPGFITANLAEATEAAWWFKLKHKSFVFKYNRGVQGIGVVICEQNEFSEEKQTFEAQVNERLADSMWREPMVIVEEAIQPDLDQLGGSPNVEFYIDRQGQVIYSYPCEQILENKQNFIGVYLHPELSKNIHLQRAKEAGEVYGQALAKADYRGVFDIDLVVTKDLKTYAVESNLRRTGGTHLHELALALLGSNYWERYYLMIEEHKLNRRGWIYSELKSMFSNLLWDKKKQYGLIFCNIEMLKVGILIPILIARSKVELAELKHNLGEKLKLL